MIYFIQDSETLHIKIGFTEADGAEERLRALQTGNSSKLVLLTTIPGNRESESRLHGHYDDLRVRGEWFLPGPLLIQFIVSVTAGLAADATDSRKGLKCGRVWKPGVAAIYPGRGTGSVICVTGSGRLRRVTVRFPSGKMVPFYPSMEPDLRLAEDDDLPFLLPVESR